MKGKAVGMDRIPMEAWLYRSTAVRVGLIEVIKQVVMCGVQNICRVTEEKKLISGNQVWFRKGRCTILIYITEYFISKRKNREIKE